MRRRMRAALLPGTGIRNGNASAHSLPFQKKPNRADHPRVVAERGGLHPKALGKARHDALKHPAAQGRHQQLLLRAHAAAHEHGFRIEYMNQPGDPGGDVADPLVQHARLPRSCAPPSISGVSKIPFRAYSTPIPFGP